ncbi:unnamed protein product, partial [Rotaria sp. Silwood2]
DEQCIGYLNSWDKTIPNPDVVDDYRTERNEVQAYRGKHVPFNFGDINHIDYYFLSFFVYST